MSLPNYVKILALNTAVRWGISEEEALPRVKEEMLLDVVNPVIRHGSAGNVTPLVQTMYDLLDEMDPFTFAQIEYMWVLSDLGGVQLSYLLKRVGSGGVVGQLTPRASDGSVFNAENLHREIHVVSYSTNSDGVQLAAPLGRTSFKHTILKTGAIVKRHVVLEMGGNPVPFTPVMF